MSQGYIGYHLQQALGQAFKEKGINKTDSLKMHVC